MGMFTRIVHPKDGRELQIKTGRDQCEQYHLHDSVPFEVHKDSYLSYSGIPDGVYPSYSDKGEDDWVIIKDHKVHAVANRRWTVGYLIKKYKISGIKKSWYTKEAYEKYKQENKVRSQEWKKYLKSIKHLPESQRLGAIMAYPIRQAIDYVGIGRKILKVEKI